MALRRTVVAIVGSLVLSGASSPCAAQTWPPGVLGRDTYQIGCRVLRGSELRSLGIRRGRSGLDCRLVHLIPDIVPTDPTMGLDSMCVAPSAVHAQVLPDRVTPVTCIDARWVVERTLLVYRRGGRETVCEYDAQLEDDSAGTVRHVFFDSCGV